MVKLVGENERDTKAISQILECVDQFIESIHLCAIARERKNFDILANEEKDAEYWRSMIGSKVAFALRPQEFLDAQIVKNEDEKVQGNS